MPLILASTSASRRAMLAAAGVDVRVVAPTCDEEAVKAAHQGDQQALVEQLATLKAKSVETARGDWVIGSDSSVAVDGQLFSKPRDRAEATAHLRAFSGRTMHLASAVALARAGIVDWRHAETARLKVRHLSDAFVESYLDAEWPAVGHCVGVFRIEGRGVELFETIDGSQFTILGMPLLPLLGALRERGELAA